MVPPLDIILEISDQLLRCREHVGTFFSIKMPVTFATCNYGVPQSRRRIFIYGMRNGKLPTFPMPTHFGEEEG
ncbi:MAG: DNA cytosine methyltransferase [Deltaproteobacteria bacterium]|nr:DNA cytosine methyltransferase [Deltaproteobacteria bacterium]